MSESFIIGRYVPGGSIIHRLDPRLKIGIVFFYVIIVFSAETLASYSVLLFFSLLSAILTKIHVSYIIKGLKPLWFIVAITFILHFILTRDGQELFSIFGFPLYKEALIQAIEISGRLFLLIFMTTLLTLTTTPIEITDAIEVLLKPLNKVKFPVHELALMMSISLRFIPTLMLETEKISKAQSSRGLDIATGPFKERLKAVIPLLIPLFISAFKRAEELATAMEARGYRGGEGRTKLRELRLDRLDYVAIVFFLLVMVLFFVLRT
ncbi:energy-coupling factor transporter transmembrane component T family protein [Bacillaceae bacterium W0354]